MVKLRRPSLKVMARNDALLTHIKSIKLNHPFWGYRRVWAYLNYHLKCQVNKKRVYRVMQGQSFIGERTQALARKTK